MTGFDAYLLVIGFLLGWLGSTILNHVIIPIIKEAKKRL